MGNFNFGPDVGMSQRNKGKRKTFGGDLRAMSESGEGHMSFEKSVFHGAEASRFKSKRLECGVEEKRNGGEKGVYIDSFV